MHQDKNKPYKNVPDNNVTDQNEPRLDKNVPDNNVSSANNKEVAKIGNFLLFSWPIMAKLMALSKI